MSSKDIIRMQVVAAMIQHLLVEAIDLCHPCFVVKRTLTIAVSSTDVLMMGKLRVTLERILSEFPEWSFSVTASWSNA